MIDSKTIKQPNERLLEQILAGEPITLDGKTKPLLVHALDNQDLRLFSIALKSGATVDFSYSPGGVITKADKPTFQDYLKQRVRQSYSLKPFYTKLQSHLFWQRHRKDFSKYVYRGLLFVGLITAALFNIFFMLQSFLFAQETLQLLNMVVDNATTLGLIGLTLNGILLAHKIHHNFSNPAKSLASNLITLGYDVGAFLIKAGGYVSYLILGVTPIAGMFFVTALAFGSTRGLLKLGRAAYNHWQYRKQYRTTEFKQDEVYAADTIRSYNRTNYKMLSVINTTITSVAITCIIAAYCFMPLTPLGTVVIATSMIAVNVSRWAVGTALDSWFESRTQRQIDVHMQAQGQNKITPAQDKAAAKNLMPYTSTQEILEELDNKAAHDQYLKSNDYNQSADRHAQTLMSWLEKTHQVDTRHFHYDFDQATAKTPVAAAG